MNSTFIIAVIAVVLVIAVYNRYWKKDKRNGKKDAELELIPEMEKIFLDRVSEGSKMYALASVYDDYDIMTLKTLFQSEQIPYYFEFENTSKAIIGIPPAAINATIIKILDTDYDDALLVLNKYIENKTAADKPVDTGGAPGSGTIEIFKKS